MLNLMQKKAQVLKEAVDALKDNDISRINAAIDNARRVRK